MPLVTVYTHEMIKERAEVKRFMASFRRGIRTAVIEALVVKNVVLIEVPARGELDIFIDISGNFQEWRNNKDLAERHQQIGAWVKKTARGVGMKSNLIQLRLSLAHVEYSRL
ncbi:MAG: hypothetical protein AB200_00805 [Parcubacteria bacterium C7867-005]|nr:MAG: hypothetical protein AB200_00805 [Parcubacteria bacterium C7867-005]